MSKRRRRPINDTTMKLASEQFKQRVADEHVRSVIPDEDLDQLAAVDVKAYEEAEAIDTAASELEDEAPALH